MSCGLPRLQSTHKGRAVRAPQAQRVFDSVSTVGSWGSSRRRLSWGRGLVDDAPEQIPNCGKASLDKVDNTFLEGPDALFNGVFVLDEEGFEISVVHVGRSLELYSLGSERRGKTRPTYLRLRQREEQKEDGFDFPVERQPEEDELGRCLRRTRPDCIPADKPTGEILEPNKSGDLQAR